MKKHDLRWRGLMAGAATLAICAAGGLARAEGPAPAMVDPQLLAWSKLAADRKPAPPVPGKDDGMDAATGKFIAPGCRCADPDEIAP